MGSFGGPDRPHRRDGLRGNRRWSGTLAFGLVATALIVPARAAETWMLQNGEEYYGELVSYSFATKEVTLRKVDGKPFSFPARELAFGAKTKLIFSPPFFRALRRYRPPPGPVLGLLLVVLLGVFVPVFVGLVGSAHVLGMEATVPQHARGYLKVMALLVVMGFGWLVAATVLDRKTPVLPDNNADLVLLLTSLVCGILFSSVLVSLHYHRSFFKGLAVTLLAGVFSTILWTAGILGALFLTTRRDLESVVTRLVFEPFGWF